MRGPGFWERLLVLDDGPQWSVIPAIPVSRAAAVGMQLAWAAIAFAPALLKASAGLETFALWLWGGFVVDYIVRRCRRVPAYLGGTTVKPDSHFLARLVFDLLMPIALVVIAVETHYGVGAIRNWVRALFT